MNFARGRAHRARAMGEIFHARDLPMVTPTHGVGKFPVEFVALAREILICHVSPSGLQHSQLCVDKPR